MNPQAFVIAGIVNYYLRDVHHFEEIIDKLTQVLARAKHTAQSGVSNI